jgi:hypothetical protein
MKLARVAAVLAAASILVAACGGAASPTPAASTGAQACVTPPADPLGVGDPAG